MHKSPIKKSPSCLGMGFLCFATVLAPVLLGSSASHRVTGLYTHTTSPFLFNMWGTEESIGSLGLGL